MPKIAKLIVATIAMCFYSNSSLASNCALGIDAKVNPIEPIISCLKELEAENATLRNNIGVRNSNIEAQIVMALEKWVKANPAVGARLPSGAVVAFNRTKSKPCPDGWFLFEPAISRMIVGAGHPQNEISLLTQRLSYKDDKSPKRISAIGGEEKVTLTSEHIPEHNHGIYFSLAEGAARPLFWFDEQGASNKVASPSPRKNAEKPNFGGNDVHNNMPPYIALYYCEKN